MLATHLTEVVRKHADEILNRDATKHLIDELKKTSPAVVDELIPGMMKLTDVQQVLQLLLREAVPIRQLGPDPGNAGRVRRADQGPDPADRIRAPSPGALDLHALSRQRKPHVRRDARSGPGRPHSRGAGAQRARAVRADVAAAVETTCRLIGAETDKLVAANRTPIVLVSPQIRPGLKQMTASHLPRLVVLSYNEITRDTRIEAVAMVSDAR